ncbi:PAS domain S-box protein [candidate division KSB1 bacterium]
MNNKSKVPEKSRNEQKRGKMKEGYKKENIFEKQQIYQSLFEKASDYIVLIDSEGCIRELNDKIEQGLGYKKEEIIGKNLMDVPFLKNEGKQKVFENAKNRLKGGQIPTYELDFYNIDGNLIMGEVNASLIQLSDGTAGDLVIIRDISDRKKSENDLRTMTERLALATDIALIGIWDWDVKNNVLIWDNTMYELYGIRKEDFSEAYDAWIKGLHPKDRDRSKKEVELALKDKKVFDTDFRIVWPDKTIRYIRGIASVTRDNNGNPIRMLGVNWDITDYKNAEKGKIEQTEALEKFSFNVKLLHRITTKSYKDFDELLIEYLEAGCKIFDLPTGIISKIEDQKYTILATISDLEFLKPGVVFELKDTYCKLVKRARATLAFESAKNTAQNMSHPIIPNDFFEAYISAPIYVGREVYGTLNFSSPKERAKSFQPYDYEMIELMAESLGRFIVSRKSESHRKEIERALRDSEIRNRTLIDTAVDAIITMDNKGTIQSVNKAFKRMFHYSENDVIGNNVKMLMPEPYHSNHDKYLYNYLKTGKKKIIGIGRELKAQRKDGKVFDISLSVSEMKLGDQILFAGMLHDITGRKKAENELRQSRESLAKAQQIAHIGNWEWNLKTSELFWSDETYRIFGIDPKKTSATYDSYFKAVPEEEKSKLKKTIEHSIKTGESYSIEHRIIRPDGTERTVLGRGEAIFDYSMKTERLLGTVQDITERKKAEDQLRKLNQAVEQSPISIVITNIEGNIEYVNPKFEKITGYTFEEVKDENPRILNSGNQSKTFYKEMWEVITSGKEWSGEFQNKKKNGEIYWEFASISPVKNSMGEITHYIAVKEDVTEKKKIENERDKLIEKLEQQSVELDAILTNIGDAIVSLDEKHCIKSVNPAFLELFGLDKDEVIGKNCDSVLSSIDNESYYDPNIDADIDKGEKTVSRTQFTDRDGGKITIQSISSPLKTPDGEVVGSVKSIRDVSKEAEIDKMKTEFISMVSHELRTPLTSIKGYIDLILGGDTGDINDLQKEFLEIVFDNSERLNNLINDLLDVEKIETGRVQLNFKPVSLTDIVNVGIKTMQAAIDKKGLKLNSDIEEGIMYSGDKERLIQVVANLLSNALKYTKKGTVTVNLKNIKNSPVITVKDTGIGISAENKEKLFTKFFRADNDYTREVGGTGLGLSIVKAIVNKHGGTINVKSTLNRGSEFAVIFPQLNSKNE